MRISATTPPIRLNTPIQANRRTPSARFSAAPQKKISLLNHPLQTHFSIQHPELPRPLNLTLYIEDMDSANPNHLGFQYRAIDRQAGRYSFKQIQNAVSFELLYTDSYTEGLTQELDYREFFQQNSPEEFAWFNWPESNDIAFNPKIRVLLAQALLDEAIQKIENDFQTSWPPKPKTLAMPVYEKSQMDVALALGFKPLPVKASEELMAEMQTLGRVKYDVPMIFYRPIDSPSPIVPAPELQIVPITADPPKLVTREDVHPQTHSNHISFPNNAGDSRPNILLSHDGEPVISVIDSPPGFILERKHPGVLQLNVSQGLNPEQSKVNGRKIGRAGTYFLNPGDELRAGAHVYACDASGLRLLSAQADAYERLFPRGLKHLQFKQGGYGDCYFLSAIAIAASHPKARQRLAQTVTLNTKGEAQVVFYGLPDLPQTVRIPLPFKDGRVHGPLGLQIIEEAFGQMLATKGKTSMRKALNGGSPASALELLTGFQQSDYAISHTTSDGKRIVDDDTLLSSLKLLAKAAQDPGRYLIGASRNKLKKGEVNEYPQFPTQHAYILRKIDLENDLIIVTDPHDTRRKERQLDIKSFSEIFDHLWLARDTAETDSVASN